MKKLISSICLGTALTFTYSFAPNLSVEEVSSVNCHYSQCQATAKSTGNQCKHCVSNEGDLYCWQHR